MPCLIAAVALISPRLAIVVMWLATDLLDRAFEDWVLPLLGFLLLPWTTVAYALMWSVGTAEVTGFEWFFVGLAVVVDVAAVLRRRG